MLPAQLAGAKENTDDLKSVSIASVGEPIGVFLPFIQPPASMAFTETLSLR